MCGIAGIINLNKEKCSTHEISGMCRALAHRGPDDEGYLLYENLALGHRRLSIIDLSPAAHQPMLSEDGNIVLTYNGEIYNFDDLRDELKKKGHTFRSHSDAEVVIHSYEEWGTNCLDKFNGMFAFAILDKKNGLLLFARDRYGIKPFYYWQNEKVFLFASEIKAFLVHPQFRVHLDLEVLYEYFTFQNTFSAKTIFKGVRLLPPGHFMLISLKDAFRAKAVQYWDFHFREDKPIKREDEYLEELDRLLRQAVKRQLVSDVEVGSYLSGGIDSGSIVAIATQSFKNLKTFCIGFDLSSASGLELSFDERRKAEYISYLYQTEHYEMVLKSGDMQRCLPHLVWALEDLRLGQSYPNFYASKLASRFVKVCLSGAGGDELFAGYPWRYYMNLNNNSADGYIDGYYRYWQRLVPNKTLQELFMPVREQVRHVWTENIFRSIFNGHNLIPQNAEDYINHSLYFEAKTFLHGLLLVEDKLSMANGLEVRVPFLDNDLVDFAERVPVRLKLKVLGESLKIDEDEPVKKQRYFTETKDGKLILRKALSKYLDGKITYQNKQGFSGPDASWFKGESIDYVRQLFFNKRAYLYEFLDKDTVQNLINDHLKGRCNRRLFIWSLLNFEWWCRKFIAKEESLL